MRENVRIQYSKEHCYSSGNCLINMKTKTLVEGSDNSVIPTDGSVTSIGTGAFNGCSNLTSITIPVGVKSIGDCAFYNCRSLTSITIPDSVTSIGDSAFYGCSGLTSLTIPHSVISIGDRAFRGCRDLTIYAEAAAKPDGWSGDWNYSNCLVVWGYKG